VGCLFAGGASEGLGVGSAWGRRDSHAHCLSHRVVAVSAMSEKVQIAGAIVEASASCGTEELDGRVSIVVNAGGAKGLRSLYARALASHTV